MPFASVNFAGGHLLRKKPTFRSHDFVKELFQPVICSAHAHHDAERVEDVGLAVFLFLASVGFGGDLDGSIEQ